VRDGAYLAPGVICMPPMYVNIGAWVGGDTLIDSHALIGSCAQIGARVHVSAGAQIGGVIEPVGALPVIVEDEALIGGNCGVYEGTIVGRRAVLGAGVILTGAVAVYDLVRRSTHRRTAEGPLRIPEGAVVVPGSRRVEGAFAERHGLSVATPLIVKYRDERTDAVTALEEALR
jgi:2,3,4,5-tetrahydropyridine-2-carboxylate N-succinyltransferase